MAVCKGFFFSWLFNECPLTRLEDSAQSARPSGRWRPVTRAQTKLCLNSYLVLIQPGFLRNTNSVVERKSACSASSPTHTQTTHTPTQGSTQGSGVRGGPVLTHRLPAPLWWGVHPGRGRRWTGRRRGLCPPPPRSAPATNMFSSAPSLRDMTEHTCLCTAPV